MRSPLSGLTGNFTYEAENEPTPQEQEENLREESVKHAEKQLAMEELAKDSRHKVCGEEGRIDGPYTRS